MEESNSVESVPGISLQGSLLILLLGKWVWSSKCDQSKNLLLPIASYSSTVLVCQLIPGSFIVVYVDSTLGRDAKWG
jgi:hypothetical protein